MQILTTQKLRFFTPDRSASVVARPNQIETIPDWAVHDEMFRAARAAGLIKVIADAVSIPVQASVAVDTSPNLSTVIPVEEETPEDDGTTDVKSLAAKLGLKIGETITLLKEQFNFTAGTGKALLSQELFDAVLASRTPAPVPTPTETPEPTETAGGF